MRSLLIAVITLMFVSKVMAQEKDGWKKYKSQEVPVEGKSNAYFVIELEEGFDIRSNSNQFRIARRLDQNHYIVYGKKEAFGSVRSWRANHDWKLDIDPDSKSEFFYVIATDSFIPNGVEIVGQYQNVFLVKSELKKVLSMAEDPDVLNISSKNAKPSVEARVVDMNLNPNRVNKVHHFYPELDGGTELVSIQENSYRPDDIDLISRNVVTGMESSTFDNHADEMATIIGGAGNSFITGKGVARNVGVTSSDFTMVLPDEDAYYQDNGILTQNHSYGLDQDTLYRAEAVAFDLSAYSNRNLLHVFSSGNEGFAVSEGGTYKGMEGFANLTGNIKMTKNSLVVGSVDTVANEVAFVSRGPTYDGRVKPEVVAYSNVGSSNSAALVSGISVLLQQEYRQQAGEDMPSSLVKALMINSADDVGKEGLDFATGYGSVNAYRSIHALKNGQYFSGFVTQGSTMDFDLEIPDNAQNLKVTICWTDPPANAGDAIALINDLDIRLLDESSNAVLPWILDHSPSEAALAAPATRAVDRLNNVEQVTIENPQGPYTIAVEGYSVDGMQQFHIAYQYDLEETFEWDYPTGSDNMPFNGESGSYFRWSTTYQGSAALDYSVDNGTTWQLLENSIDLDRGFWRWNNPPLYGDSAIARMTIEGNRFVSDVFTLSTPPEASVGFNCGDSVMLRWTPVDKAVGYTIFRMGATELEELTMVEDTFIVIDKGSLMDQRLSIQPNLSSGKGLLPAPTFDYTVQGIDCYIFSFFQTVALDTGIYLNLSLGTTYGVERITFQRNDLSRYVEIGVIENPVKDEILFLDESPTQGYNEHRVLIDFENGEQIVMTGGSSYYLTDIPVRVFPNPAPASGIVDIITREFENRTPTLELMDSKGSIILRKTLSGTLDFIPLTGIQPGIYYYRLLADGNTYRDRLIIR